MIDKRKTVEILMIEDRKLYYELFRDTILEEWPNAKITFAGSGADAKKVVSSNLAEELHLIIMDLGLPDCDGEDLVTEFRKMDRLRTTPILILTGTDDEETQSRLLKKGANDFVAKGSSPELFLARLQIQLHNKLTSDQLTQKALNMEMFTTGVLHDIRNIETNVLALCELVERQVKRDPFQHKETILNDIASLKSQTLRINDYASSILKKVKSSHHPYSPTNIAIADVMQWVSHVISNEADFKWHIHKSRPLEDLYCDTSMIKLAFLNICQNSLKYKKDNQPCEIHIFQDKSDKDDPKVTTYIEDNGRGLRNEEDFHRIFLPFERAENSAEKEGFGLGLALVAKVIANMQGEVWAENASEFSKQGLKIGIRLPKATAKSTKST